MPVCRKCETEFPNRMVIDGESKSLQNRKYCLTCSPYKEHNTKKIEIEKTVECKTCGETNPDMFYKRGNNLYENCKSCHNKVTYETKVKNKKRAVEYLGGKCSKCGYDKYIGCLDIHHLNPETKSPTFNRWRGWSWERVKVELDGCVLLCRNCHGEEHAEEDFT